MDVKQSLFITTDLSFLLNQPQKMNICKGENTLSIAWVGSEGKGGALAPPWYFDF
jgi:hypothetical protein